MTDKRKTPPIEEKEFIGGAAVVDIGDIRVARGLSRRPYSVCSHRRLVYDRNERRIWCKDCECDVEAFDALVLVTEQYGRALRGLNDREKRIAEAEAAALRTIAAQVIDKVWRTRKMVPVCAECGGGLLPEDFKFGTAGQMSAEFARARRARRRK
ncbi:hypothetical protein KQX64_06970 [Rhodopseudomonas palustris]|nr:hypothetical protein KQX64_06970 [Rhodopseudomonas palustris]